MSRPVPFTKLGLEPAEAYILAIHMAFANALSDAVINGQLTESAGQEIDDQFWADSHTLMTGGALNVDLPGARMEFSAGNPYFNKASDEVATHLEGIAEELENVAAD